MARSAASRIIAAILLPLLAGCTVGPNYKRPAVTTPQTFRGRARCAGRRSFVRG